VFARGFLVFVGVVALSAPGLAQPTDYSAGKTPAQLFAGDCSSCHKSPRGLAKGMDSRSLAGFLREHYTTRPENAAAVAAYLLGNPGPATEPRQEVQSRGRKPRTAATPASEPEKPKATEELSPFERLFGRVPSEPEPGTPVIATPEEASNPEGASEARGKPARVRPERGQKRKPSEAAAHRPPAAEAGKPDGKPVDAAGEEAGKAEAAKAEAAKSEAAKSEAAKAEATRAEHLRAEKAKAEAARTQAARAEAAKAEAEKAEAAKEAAAREAAAKVEAAKAEAAKLHSYATGGEEARPPSQELPGAPSDGAGKPGGEPPG